jgi:sulfur transfer complex TusBCD TusB component (DsrH family)
MKLTNKKLVESMGLVQQIAQKQLPVKASYAISQNIGKIKPILETYDKEREKILNKYAEKDDKGKIVLQADGISAKLKDAKAVESFRKDIDTLLNISNDIDIRTIKISDIGDVKFSAAELSAIDYMIAE